MRQQTRVVTRLRHLLRFLTKEERRGLCTAGAGGDFHTFTRRENLDDKRRGEKGLGTAGGRREEGDEVENKPQP